MQNRAFFARKMLTFQKKTVYMVLLSEFGTTERSWPVGRMAHAEDCKSFYIGSIPVPASKVYSDLAQR